MSNSMRDLRLGATGNFPEGKLNDEDEGELRMAVGTKPGKVIITFGKPVAWIGLSPADARKLAVFMMARANVADELEPFLRASGKVVCDVCGDLYCHHPHDMRVLDYQGEPFLRVRCDGRRLKL